MTNKQLIEMAKAAGLPYSPLERKNGFGFRTGESGPGCLHWGFCSDCKTPLTDVPHVVELKNNVPVSGSKVLCIPCAVKRIK